MGGMGVDTHPWTCYSPLIMTTETNTNARRKPPIKCTPCRVLYNNESYRIYPDGSVSGSLSFSEAKDLGVGSVRDHLAYEAEKLPRYEPHSSEARTIRREASRLRRNRNARERRQAMKDLGLRQTRYGWE